MKKICILYSLLIAFISVAHAPLFAATVGNPLDLDVPKTSAALRQEIINQTLDEYEQIIKIKTSLDMEFLFDKDLHTTGEVENAELKGQWYMAKLGVTILDRVEPYIKIGTSKLEAKWKQNKMYEIEVESDYGFAYGAGLKGIIWEHDGWGIRLTGDLQYRTLEAGAGDIGLGNTGINDVGADFKVDEWQASIVLSKKYILPLRWQDIYIVPYTGLNLSDSTVDVSFTNPSAPAQDWTLFDANNDSMYGFFMGCDIMPTLRSSFIYSIEVRLINEFALTLGGAMKF